MFIINFINRERKGEGERGGASERGRGGGKGERKRIRLAFNETLIICMHLLCTIQSENVSCYILKTNNLFLFEYVHIIYSAINYS